MASISQLVWRRAKFRCESRCCSRPRFDRKEPSLKLESPHIALHSYNVSTRAMIHSRWTDTTARIHSLAFNAASTHLAAASLDESIRIYSVTSPSQVIAAKNAYVHPSSARSS